MQSEPPIENVQTLIIGAGFAGIGAARLLIRQGITDFVLVDRASGVGGVWEANRYPGAACDVPSHLYSFSFAPATHWSRRYGPQPEIRQYLRETADSLELADRLQLNTEIAGASWDAERASWLVSALDGRQWRARILISAVGQLSLPATPSIPGLDKFAGPRVHSANWPEDLDLRGKRVAVIGSGASAIQFVPAIVPDVDHLTVFQRSAPYVLPKPDRAYGERERRRFARWPLLQRIGRTLQYFSHEVRGMILLHSPLLLRGYQWYFNRTLNREIADPVLREQLRPRERLGCKRVLFSNAWYPALSDPNVTVVSHKIDRIEADAVVTEDGTRHRADVLIMGTGFQATRFLSPMRIEGSGGIDLNQAWQRGAEAYLGLCMPGFANFFMLYGPNTNLGHNSIVFMLECQFRYLRGALAALQAEPKSSLQIRAPVQARYQEALDKRLRGSIWAAGCSSWYHDEHGRITTNWPGSTLSYAWLTRRFQRGAFEDVSNQTQETSA